MKVALLTCQELEGYFAYEEHLDRALEKSNIDFEWVIWTNWKEVDWDKYSAVLIRTTWDYQKKIDEFLEAMSFISSKTKLFNSFSIVKWNHSKDYLLEFNETETKPVPTQEIFIKCKDDLAGLFEELESEELIIKPFISATAHDTFHLNRDNWESHLDEIIKVNQKKRMMVQPFLVNIQNEGEYSLHFFDGEFSHAILKTPKNGDFRSQEEYGSHIQSTVPNEKMLDFAHKVLSKLEEKLLYARVDFVRSETGEFFLMELELIEPSLYFGHGEGSAEKLVKALIKRIA
jgi:hypothetical protein